MLHPPGFLAEPLPDRRADRQIDGRHIRRSNALPCRNRVLNRSYGNDLERTMTAPAVIHKNKKINPMKNEQSCPDGHHHERHHGGTNDDGCIRHDLSPFCYVVDNIHLFTKRCKRISRPLTYFAQHNDPTSLQTTAYRFAIILAAIRLPIIWITSTSTRITTTETNITSPRNRWYPYRMAKSPRPPPPMAPAMAE